CTGELLVDDFADGDLESPLGLPWMVIGDDLMGGGSKATLAVESPGESQVMVLDGRLDVPEALPISFVGAWTAVGGDGLPRDLSAYRGLRLRARTSAGTFQAGARRAGVTTNFLAPIALGTEWTDVDVPFAALEPAGGGDTATEWNASGVTWVGVSASGREAGPVHIEIERFAVYGGPNARNAPASTATRASPTARTQLIDAGTLSALDWTIVADEEAGDASRPRLPDARSLAWAHGHDGRLWFRVTLADAPPRDWLGINIALDTDGDSETGMAWWGSNSGFRFDRLVTAYLTRAAGYWLGALGVASADDVPRGVIDGVTDDVVAAVDREHSAFLVGVPGEALAADGPVRLIATVGSSMINNDDLPNNGAVLVDFVAAGEF
ncbi:MAG: CIA30 family protein, partial [Longimicrobiales bacterium]